MAKEKALVKQEKNIPSLIPQTWDQQKEFFLEITKAGDSGVKTLGDAILKYQKARELGIGWGNALPHIHTINSKAGIDTHIMKAILSNPNSGVTFKLIEDFVPIYNYTDGVDVYTEDTLPSIAEIIKRGDKDAAAEVRKRGKIPVVIMPTKEDYVETDANGKKVKKVRHVVKPTDYRTTYLFTREKKSGISGKLVTEEFKSSFTWSEALKTGKPYDANGQLNPSSPWQAWRKVMMRTKPFAIGAREIANDLLMGVMETTELYESENVPFNIKETEEGDIYVEAQEVKESST